MLKIFFPKEHRIGLPIATLKRVPILVNLNIIVILYFILACYARYKTDPVGFRIFVIVVTVTSLLYVTSLLLVRLRHYLSASILSDIGLLLDTLWIGILIPFADGRDLYRLAVYIFAACIVNSMLALKREQILIYACISLAVLTATPLFVYVPKLGGLTSELRTILITMVLLFIPVNISLFFTSKLATDLVSIAENELAINRENERTLEKIVNERTTQLIEAEKFAFLGTLVAGVAHEINTPIGVGITAVSYQRTEAERIFSQLNNNTLKKSDLDKFIQDTLESSRIIESNLVRAGTFIQSFKMIAVDQSTEDKRRFKVKEYLDEIVFAMRPKLKNTKHTVVIECDEKLEILSYPGGLSQIITNLIVNSLVHGLSIDMQGIIRIQIEVDRESLVHEGHSERWVTIKYSDNGKGIAPENLSKIFTPFFTTLKGSGGTGLGLYIIQRTTASLGGSISCESELGKGVCFTIHLPVENV